MRLRVIVADDHPVVCSGLKQILERDSTIEIVADARDGRTLLRQVEALQPDLVVADVTMPDLNGIDATRIIRQRHSGTRVLLLSVHAQEAIVREALAAGASGYVLKEAAGDELQRAVDAVARDQSYFSPEVARLLATRLMEPRKDRPLLSAREREVLQLICEGRRPAQIAAQLFVSVTTVKTHRANAMRKLGARSTAELIRYAIRAGLASL